MEFLSKKNSPKRRSLKPEKNIRFEISKKAPHFPDVFALT
ncbi:hypothetical protein LEP1GSC103_3886 [Leptospira borgpetersenii serovar Javanica str. UI 09931]|uniref:Uncharacterized protein n=5 Tax=Leptospira borgpetersenii TaxID=174 RepID=M3HWE8_LEPBO|nr:hypothetical protein LBBP_00718 [Leptospira borgpetersenii serovar Ballum]EKP14991.1 hypothetical protein LEP1GSC128_2299 [Leptospira borgpetersenii str. 200801926]EKQ91339.1 hypothetical protein LEP1GSC101_1596 [Leptospira borgpetersenii str. UI 09149]EKR02108.1 hypothetical protein LEP1GSC121_0993 [Leptospira borgpetersenii serovar Castellonis str. 200801910]EMG01920.1 hypothetical protein LEP1GSC123_0271 [Leptospira borgpetersenii str. 200701203]EMK11480.1 hypothetical protein LEP1GSC066